MKIRAFTLIELLIVVAIIAILAAIAVPNFLEAQTRAKVSRSRADIRSISTALEAYRVDWNWYPISGTRVTMIAGQAIDNAHLNFTLSTPIAYITNANLVDPFNTQEGLIFDRTFRYVNIDETYGPVYVSLPDFYTAYQTVHGKWFLSSDGPDRTYGPSTSATGDPPGLFFAPVIYDPTNGTVSEGDVLRSQKLGDVVTYGIDTILP